LADRGLRFGGGHQPFTVTPGKRGPCLRVGEVKMSAEDSQGRNGANGDAQRLNVVDTLAQLARALLAKSAIANLRFVSVPPFLRCEAP
jgi:hypothetical protein